MEKASKRRKKNLNTKREGILTYEWINNRDGWNGNEFIN